MKIIDEDLITADPVAFLSNKDIEVSVLRLDRIHPVISGNKWYKLRFYLQDALEQNKKTIVTFGGAYSNHIVATAALCSAYGLKSTGVIRGEEPALYSHTLKEAVSYGMQLFFVSREAYKANPIPDNFTKADHYMVPEGGYGSKGASGAASIPYEKNRFDTVCCATGTGTMMAGLINAQAGGTKVLGFSVLKNNFSIENEIRQLLNDKTKDININHDFHFGGYAKHKPELIQFMNELYTETGIPTDFVYTAKLFYGVQQLIKEKQFKQGTKILIVHSGGLQGNLSLRKGTLIY